MNPDSKIVSITALKKNLRRHRRAGKRIAFTNGCFDILHYGHAWYLNQSKKRNRVLIVGLNSDASVRRLKGRFRPVVGEKHRAYVLASLEAVDYVVSFKEDTPLHLIREIKPDVLIKGADWKKKGIVGAKEVKTWKGRVEFVPFRRGFSSTKMIRKIRSYAESF